MADGDKIPLEYLVRITSYRLGSTVIAPIQEDVVLGVESQWDPVVPTSILRSANVLIQAAGKVLGEPELRSAITSATTRRIWSGTSPISVSLRLKFEAVEDAYNEVVEPCRLLQTMAIPSDPNFGGGTEFDMKEADYHSVTGIKKIISNFPALQPPGPSPFELQGIMSGGINYLNKSHSDILGGLAGGDFIIIELGTFLTFWNVVIREDSVTYKTKFDRFGYPISAEAVIRFETYEMPTKESLESTYTRIVPVEVGPPEA